MTDLNKEREAFLNTFQYYKGSRDIIFSNEHELFMTRSNNPSEIAQKEISNMNSRWDAWLRCAKHRDAELEKAKAQAVQQSFEIGRLQDRITELLDERQDLYAQINNDHTVPEGYVLVPKDIPDRVVSCLENSRFHWGDGTRDYYTPVYSLMVEAAGDQNENS
ncbi:hypothetical protein [Acinetobacter baumannii]|nr:hypothetical protein [Acinetobacter baumannii]